MSRFWGWIAAIVVVASVTDSFGFEPKDYVFLLSAQISDAPARLILSWPLNPAKQISIRRKLPTDSDWGPVIATLPVGSTSFTDEQVDVGKAYEYQVSGLLSEQPSNIAY